MDDDIRDYLRELIAQLPTRQAAAELGYSLTSYSSLRKLLDDYGVDIPPRRNQYEALSADIDQEYVVAPKVSVRPVHARTVDIERAVVFGDNHGRQTDPKSFGVFLAVLRDVKPKYGFINGDFIDFESISRFSKDPVVSLELQAEIDNANYLLDKLIEASPDTTWVYVEGNHEVRLREYVRKNAPSLVGIRTYGASTSALSVESLLGLEQRGIRYVKQTGKSAYTNYGVITIGHFDKYSANPGAVAKWFLEHRNESVIQGHTHKCSQLFRRFPDGREITCIEHGHLMKANPDYVTDPDWCQGFVIVTKRTDTNRFHAELIRIVDHECLYGNVLYSG